MFIASSENHSGTSACDITHNTSSGFTITDHQEYTVNEAQLGDHFYRRWVLLGLTLSAGEYISFYDGTSSGTLIASIAGPFSGSFDTGCFQVTSSPKLVTQVFHGLPQSDCLDDSDCGPFEKCVGGECVPCDEQQATHFQIRFEYSELATDAGANQTMYHLSSIIPIASSEGLVIEGTEINQSRYYPRIRFCDASGAIKPYTGTLSFYGLTSPDKSWALFPSNANLTEASTFLGAESQTDAVSHNPWFVPRILINHIDSSAVIYEADCSSVTPEEPPDIEPVTPVPPEEPDEPVEPDDPEEPDEPDKPTPPSQPQEGLCPCEEYIGLQIKRAADILYDGLILLKRELSVVGREIVVELWEKRKMDYQLSMFFQNQQFQLMQSHHQRLFEIRQILESIRDDINKGLIKENESILDSISDSLRLPSCEPDYPEGKTITQIADEFVQKYEPVDVVVEESDVWQQSPDEAPRNYPRKF